MLVYHGSTQIVQRPLTHIGRKDLDFSCGFCITRLQKQAESWAQKIAQIKKQKAIVNIYDFDIEQVRINYKYHIFDSYNIEWLTYIVDNRRNGLTPDYEVVEGGVANERVIDSIEAFMTGFMTMETALNRLSEHKLNNQICIRMQEIIDQYLHYISAYTL